MMAWSGQPVLALVDASHIPALPTAETALYGLAAGFLAALNVALHHDVDGERQFTGAVIAARKHADYDYSREFLAGIEAAKTELAKLSGGQS